MKMKMKKNVPKPYVSMSIMCRKRNISVPEWRPDKQQWTTNNIMIKTLTLVKMRPFFFFFFRLQCRKYFYAVLLVFFPFGCYCVQHPTLAFMKCDCYVKNFLKQKITHAGNLVRYDLIFVFSFFFFFCA